MVRKQITCRFSKEWVSTVTLKDEIQTLRQKPQEFIGKKVRGPNWDKLREILMVTPQSDGFSIIFSTLDRKQTSPLHLSVDQLAEIEIITPDFGGNAPLFFLAVMGQIIRNNYESDPFFAVGISNIDPLPHQLDAVYNHVLPRGRLRFMIADDPGAGKTIMAGLVIKEYLYRGLAKRVLIIAPGGLTDQWDEEMRSKFHEDFILIDRNAYNTYRHQNVWQLHTKVITSLDFAKQKDVLENLKDVQWDLVIVDEAHKFAGDIEKDIFQPNQRYELGEIVCANAFNVLFLTATPHKGDDQVFRMLLALLEPFIFGDRYVQYAPDVKTQIETLETAGMPIFLRRLKENMVRMDKSAIFTKRRSVTVTWTISNLETDLYRAVSKYVAENFNLALRNHRTAVTFALKIMQKRLLSSSYAIYQTLKHRAERLQEILANDEFRKSQAELDAMEREFHSKLELEWEDMTDAERQKIETKILQLSMARNPADLQAEIAILEQLQSLAKRVVDDPSQETKLWELKKLLDNQLKDPQEKIIIFTEFTDTLEFLKDQISSWGYSHEIIHGGLSKSERLTAQDRFHHTVQVLIATEAAGEGINLQFCHLLINYDIPWTPTRLEQRLGRIHRYGQKQNCIFFNLVSDKAADGKPIVEGQVLATLLRKIETIKETLKAERVFDIIGDEKIFSDLSLENVFLQVISDPDGYFKIKAQLESEDLTKQVEAIVVRAKENMTVDFKTIFANIDKSKDARLWPEYVWKYVSLALECYNGSLSSALKIQVPPAMRQYDPGLPPHYEFVTFSKPDPQELEHNPDITYIAPGHPFLEAVIDYSASTAGADLFRGAIFTESDIGRLGLLWFVDQEMEDGTQRAVGKTMGIVYQAFDEQLQPTQPRVLLSMKLWDFTPLKKSLEIKLPFNLSQCQPQVEEFYRTHQGLDFINKIRVSNDRLGTIRKKAAQVAFDQQRSYVSDHILQLRQKLKNANLSEKTRATLDGHLTRARREREELEPRFREQEQLLARQNSLTPRIPHVIGVAIVVPATDIGEVDMDVLLNESARKKHIQELSDKQAVGDAAIRVVTQLEREKYRRTVASTEKINCGYDLESLNPTNPADVRRIEVKGHRGAGGTYISNNELVMGLRHGNSFWLYVVENALSPRPRLRVVQNPALKFAEKLSVVKTQRYILSQEDLERQSEVIEL